ncbi:MAG: 3-methyl-2-oxobutanoate hydroxymethyltransferase [Pseudomonadota bacterium]|jgi:3-methyl-2-oxobutanoate hydroxymethyltransferase
MSSHAEPITAPRRRKPVTLQSLRDMLARAEPISMLTAYDATFARVADDAGIDTLLVGDSLGMIIQGHSSTLPVTLDEMAYHTRCVARGLAAGGGTAFLIADLPFGSYQEGPAQALRSSTALMQAGAQMVKLEGGGWTPETVRQLTERGIPVCAHLGLTPQSVHAFGGWRVQGRDEAGATTLRRHAKELADAGAAMMVLELMPSALAASVQADNPGLITIGIGAGAGTAGQVLVQHDMLGLTRGKLPRFVRNFQAEGGSAEEAIRRYVSAVKAREYPNEALHGY